MTVPEENRRKTGKTDDTVLHPEKLREERDRERTGDPGGSTMREALEEANVAPEDFEGETEGRGETR